MKHTICVVGSSCSNDILEQLLKLEPQKKNKHAEDTLDALRYCNEQLESVVELSLGLDNENSKLKSENESLKKTIEHQKALIDDLSKLNAARGAHITKLIEENFKLKDECEHLRVALKLKINSIFGVPPHILGKKPEEEADK